MQHLGTRTAAGKGEIFDRNKCHKINPNDKHPPIRRVFNIWHKNKMQHPHMLRISEWAQRFNADNFATIDKIINGEQLISLFASRFFSRIAIGGDAKKATRPYLINAEKVNN